MKVQFALFLSCAAMAAASVQKVNLEFDSLTLRDGKKIERVVIQSYDPDNGKVIMLAKRHLVSYQIDQLPEDAAQQIVEFQPAATVGKPKIVRTPKSPVAHDAAPSAGKPVSATAIVVTPLSAVDESMRREQLRAAQSQALMLARAKQLAGQRADRYYRLEFHPAVGSLLIIAQSTQVADPVAIAGAEGRYRIAGTIGLQYFDDHGRDANRVMQPFEVLVGPDRHGALVAQEFVAK
jgi:hypothetical protein